jgi:Flp pilus assembly protein TadD
MRGIVSARTHRQRRGSGLARLVLIASIAMALLTPGPEARADVLDDALLLLESGDLVEAELIFEALAEEFPDSALPHYYLGVAASRRGDLAAAAVAFARAAELEPDFPWVQANLGITLYRLGEIEGAEQHLLEALLQGPEDPDVLIHLGLIEDERGEHERAAKLFVQAAELDPELSALAWYHAAESQLALGRPLAARAHLEAAVAAAGPESARLAAAELMLELDEPGSGARRWSVRAGVGLELDDNLTVPELDAATGQSDIAGVFDAGLGFDPWRGERTTVSVGYDFYQSVYRELDSLNFQNHTPRMMLRAQLRSVRSTLAYRYSHENIGGEAFLRSHRVSGGLGKELLPGWSGELALEYESLHFPPAPGRDAQRVAIFLGQQLTLADGRVGLSLDWRPEWQDAMADRFDYLENALQLRADTDLPLGSRSLGMSVYYRYQHRDYDNEEPSIGEPRRDRRHTAGLSLLFPITRRVDAIADYLHIASGSNVPALDYDENVLTLRLELWY